MNLPKTIIPLLLLLIFTGCTTSQIDTAPLVKYQALVPGTSVVVVSHSGESTDTSKNTTEQAGTLVEIQKDHLLLWGNTEGGWMTLLYPGRTVSEIRTISTNPDPRAGDDTSSAEKD